MYKSLSDFMQRPRPRFLWGDTTPARQRLKRVSHTWASRVRAARNDALRAVKRAENAHLMIPAANEQVFNTLLCFLEDVYLARLKRCSMAFYPGAWSEELPALITALERAGRALGYAEHYLKAERHRWENTFRVLAQRERLDMAERREQRRARRKQRAAQAPWAKTLH